MTKNNELMSSGYKVDIGGWGTQAVQQVLGKAWDGD